jgi:phage FluMu protein Com
MTMRLTILTLFLLSFSAKGDKVIKGKIYSSEHPQFYSIENIYVILRYDNVPFDTVLTNNNGEFLATIPIDKQTKIDILYSGIGFGTIYLKYIKQLSLDTTHLQIDLSKNYKKNIFGTAVCPKCKQTNQVYKIRYGDAPVYTFRVNKNGDTLNSAIHNGVFEAGTDVSSAQNPQWYCDRDKIKF